MRFALLAFVALVAAGCMARGASDEDQGGKKLGSSTMLEISVTPGSEAPTKIWRLRCPSGGTLPNAAEACEQLSQMDDPFAPVPKNTACTQVYGGPQEADVTGLYRGRRVKAHFDRGNGCEIERWDKVGFLFPGT